MEPASTNILQLSEVQDILKDIISDENIIDPDIDINPATEKGDNFHSIMLIVDVKGKNKELSLIFKLAPRDAKTREMLHPEIVFGQEIYFFRKIFPTFKTFQQEKGVTNLFDTYPKYYKIVDTPGEELIILENLRKSGYEMVGRREHFSEHHVSLTLKEYGKFHAISFALKDQQPEFFSDLSKVFVDIFSLQSDRMDFFEMFFHCIEQLKGLFVEETNLDLKKSVDNIKDGILLSFKKMAEYPQEEGIIVHGDCWRNNMMYKYEDQTDNKLPTKVCLLDFQLCKVGSPVMDLSHFIYTGAPSEVLDNLEKYLRIYYDSFQSHLEALGSNADKLYPFSKLMDDWKEYGKIGFLMSLLVTRTLMREDDEIKDFSDVLAEGKSLTEVFCVENKNEELINQRLKYLVLHMYDNGYL